MKEAANEKELLPFLYSHCAFVGSSGFTVFLKNGNGGSQNAATVNKILKTVENNWGNLNKLADSPESGKSSQENLVDTSEPDYVVLDNEDTVLFQTREGLSESINAAISHRDTILNIAQAGTVVGTLLLHNPCE